MNGCSVFAVSSRARLQSVHEPPVQAQSFFPICNRPDSNAAFVAAHQIDEDGGFDENDVLVLLSLPVMVVYANPQQPA